MDEALLITRCKKQEKKAQQQLFDSFADGLLPVCIRYLKDVQEAEDALLNGFFKFFRQIQSFDYRGPGSIQAWLKKIVVNECLMTLRKANRIRYAPEELAMDVSGDPGVWQALSVREILAMIDHLPDGYRTVFNLYAVEGYSHKEIGAMLQISEGTSKSQLSKARVLLQRMLLQKNNYYAAGK